MSVDEIRMHSSDFTALRVHGRDFLDLEQNVEIIKQGILGYAFGAVIRVSNQEAPHHYTVLCENLTRSFSVCLREGSRSDGPCVLPECVVSSVHES